MAEKKHFLPETLPILPVRDTVLFPGAVLPLTVGRESSLALVNSLTGDEKLLGVAAQLDPRVEDPAAADLHKVGTLAKVHKTVKMPNGNIVVFLEGLQRIRFGGVVGRVAECLRDLGLEEAIARLGDGAQGGAAPDERAVDLLDRRERHQGRGLARVAGGVGVGEVVAGGGGEGALCRQAHLRAGEDGEEVGHGYPLLETTASTGASARDPRRS